MIWSVSFLGSLLLTAASGVPSLSSLSQEDLVVTRDRCTTIAIGKKATVDGSTYATDTNDCHDCDWRMAKVPAMDWAPGSLRPIYMESSSYPRFIREDRGETWKEKNLEDVPQREAWLRSKTEILGYIPQVPHTFALIEGTYPFMNEHQVGMGESSCAAKLWTTPRNVGNGTALFNIGELMTVAMERSTTAREAIQIMGDLAMTYGYYGESWDTSRFGAAYVQGDSGEAVSVVDPHEAWVFHITADDSGTKAVWVAQRVPESHVAVVANTFVIREVDPSSPDFLFSDNLWAVAERLGWWSPQKDGLLNFLKVYAPERYHPNYSNRRVWRVFSLAAPSAALSPFTNPTADAYPFSQQVDHLLSLEEVIAFQRDHYQDTPFDTGAGLAGGPYGDPDRFDPHGWGNMTAMDTLEGEFPRTISIHRTSTATIAQARSHVPNALSLLWISLHAPDTSSFVPMHVSSRALSPHWTHGIMQVTSLYLYLLSHSPSLLCTAHPSPQKFDFDVAWWNFCLVHNYAARFYHFTIDKIRATQQEMHLHFLSQLQAVEEPLLLASGDGKAQQQQVVESLTAFTVAQGDYASQRWKDLFFELIVSYRDGYVITGQETPSVTLTNMFYPRWWLEAAGYFKTSPNHSPNAILFAPQPAASVPSVEAAPPLLPLALAALLFVGIGYALGRRGESTKRLQWLSVGGATGGVGEYNQIPEDRDNDEQIHSRL